MKYLIAHSLWRKAVCYNCLVNKIICIISKNSDKDNTVYVKLATGEVFDKDKNKKKYDEETKNKIKKIKDRLELTTLQCDFLEFATKSYLRNKASNIFLEDFDDFHVFDPPEFSKFKSLIKYKLGFDLFKNKSRGQDGYEWDFNNVNDIFIYPDGLLPLQKGYSEPEGKYVSPEQTNTVLHDILNDQANILVISGEHGIGKSEFARYLASKLYKDNSFSNGKIFFTTYDNNLNSTIANLYTYDFTASPTFEKKIQMIKQEVAEGNCLLIIDNYDSESFKNELSEDSIEYRELCETGIKLLITTTQDMSGVRGINQTVLEPLESDKQTELFNSLCFKRQDYDDRKIEKLLSEYLSGNTYLIRLAAGLTKYHSVDDIIKSIETLAKEEPVFERSVIGKDGKQDSLFKHYSALFNLSFSNIKEDVLKKKALYNLAAMPIGGLPFKLFERLAFSREGKSNALIALEELQSSYWVFFRDEKYQLHSMTKKVILEKIDFDPEYVSHLLKQLGRQIIDVESYCADFSDLLGFALSLKEILDINEFESFDTYILDAGIISLCDIVHDNSKIKEMAEQSYSNLKKIDYETVDENDLFVLANAYKNVGYALLHIDNDNDKDFQHSFDLFTKVEPMLKGREDNQSKIILSKTNGNIAARYLKLKQYDLAYKSHEDCLKYREENLPEGGEKRVACAASKKGMATAKFYLAIEEKRKGENKAAAADLFKEAFDLQGEACSDYKKSGLPEYDMDLYETEIRRAGALLFMIECLNQEEKIQTSALDIIKEVLPQLKEAYNYLKETENKQELKICQERIRKFLDLPLIKKCEFSDNFLADLKRITEYDDKQPD